ncbi:MAG: ABC transporter ATP-binding protein, partial [Paracoccaceae bacterium]
DEPLSNLDAALRMATRVEIARLHRQLGASMVYVTHDQTEAMTLADRIVVLRDGRIEQVGTPMELYNDPANRFVAGFLGSPAMNFLPGTLAASPAAEIGIRPEHIGVVADGRLQGTIAHVERLGSDTNLIVALAGGETVTVRLFGQHDHRVDAAVSLGFDDRHTFAFDAEGRRLSA